MLQRTIIVKIDEYTHEYLKEYAYISRKNLSQIVREALDKHIPFEEITLPDNIKAKLGQKG